MSTFWKYTLPTAIVLATLSFAPIVPLPEAIQEGLDRFYSNPSQAKIHIVLNQPGYAPGDTVFFKAYLTGAADSQTVKDKNILNINITNSNGQTVLYNRILMQGRSASNQLILPDTLIGRYTLVAYTDAMAATGFHPLYFQRELIVTDAKQVLSGTSGPIRVFAESGNLVAGFPNTLVVTGLNHEDSARIVDGYNTTLVKFKISPSGFGRFQLNPEKSRSYFLQHKGQEVPLPAPQDNGVAIAITRDHNGNVFANLHAGSDSIRGLDQLYLILTLNGKVCQAIDVSFDGATIPIAAGSCGFGTAQLTLFTADGIPLAERLMFIPPEPVNAEVQINKPEFKTRQQAELSVRVVDSEGIPILSDAAVSVYKKELFDNIKPASDLAAMIFFGDLDNNNSALQESSHSSYETIDNYLITRKWNRFTWNEVIKGSQTIEKSAAPIYFKGRVYDAQKQPVPNASQITFWLTHHDIRYTLQSKGNEFEFPLFMNMTDEYILYAVESKGKLVKDAFIEVDQKSIGKSEIGSTVAPYGAYPYGEFSRTKNSIRTSYSHYTIEKPANEAGVTEDPDVTPDFTVDIRKYKTFASVSEILGEVVPMVRNKKADGKSEIRVFLKETAMFASEAPLYLIDGKLTDDTDFFLALDPHAISTIGVVHSAEELTRYGVLGRNGIVIVDTTIPDHDQKIPPGKSSLLIKGINEVLPFYSPQYDEGTHTRIPDLRVCLYWNPNVIIDGTGQSSTLRFYTGDDTGVYVVRVEGLTRDGRPFVAEKIFTVLF